MLDKKPDGATDPFDCRSSSARRESENPVYEVGSLSKDFIAGFKGNDVGPDQLEQRKRRVDPGFSKACKHAKELRTIEDGDESLSSGLQCYVVADRPAEDERICCNRHRRGFLCSSGRENLTQNLVLRPRHFDDPRVSAEGRTMHRNVSHGPGRQRRIGRSEVATSTVAVMYPKIRKNRGRCDRVARKDDTAVAQKSE